MSLDDERERINKLDEEIVRLLDERGRVCRNIGAIKRAQGLPFHQPSREKEVLRRLRALSDGGMPPASIENIYRTIMAETTAMQQSEGSPVAAGCSGHGKADVTAEVLENAEAAPGFRRMRLRCPEVGGRFAPGQFFQLRIGLEGEGGFLRRPFAPSAYDESGFSFLYAVVGEGTRRMSAMVPGARVRILAPLGNGYTLPDGLRSALLVGGGCGAPSLAPLAACLRERGVRVTVLLGARSAEMLLEHDVFSALANRLVIATDNGSRGCRGTVVDAWRLERDLGDVGAVFACGPVPMLRGVRAMALEHGIPCQVSLEERMACGFGACMGCVVATTSGYRRVCHDGPVFEAETLAWDEM